MVGCNIVTSIKLGAFAGSNCNKQSSNLTVLLLLGFHSIKICREQILSYLAFHEPKHLNLDKLHYGSSKIKFTGYSKPI